MKKKHTWANAIPKTRREKDILRIMKNPAEFNRMTELLRSAKTVTENLSKFKESNFKDINEVVGFITLHLSDEFSHRDILLDELNNLMERYEERILSAQRSDKDPSV